MEQNTLQICNTFYSYINNYDMREFTTASGKTIFAPGVLVLADFRGLNEHFINEWRSNIARTKCGSIALFELYGTMEPGHRETFCNWILSKKQ